MRVCLRVSGGFPWSGHLSIFVTEYDKRWRYHSVPYYGEARLWQKVFSFSIEVSECFPVEKMIPCPQFGKIIVIGREGKRVVLRISGGSLWSGHLSIFVTKRG